MEMSIAALIILLVVGAIAGWLAGVIVTGYGFGLVGAALGNWLLGAAGLMFGIGILGAIIRATIGAVILLFLLKLVRR